MKQSIVLLGLLSIMASCASGDSSAPDRGDACTKVDLLFVVDNSGSMGDNQENLARNFPRFANDIKQALGSGIDYHVGVVTTDAYKGNDPACQALGALVTRTGGQLSSSKDCGPFKSSARFLSNGDDIGAALQCAARVGVEGDGDEDPLGAAIAAVSPTLNGPGACNAGFVRPDSLLVLVILTDEDAVTGSEQIDQLAAEFAQNLSLGRGPVDLPEKWRGALATASGHDVNTTVMVTLAKGIAGNACAANEEGQDGDTLIAYTSQYKYHFLGDICAKDYGDVLAKALESVATACRFYAIEREREREPSCQDVGVRVKDWLVSTVLLLVATLLMSVVGLQTLTRWLARKGYAQRPATLSGIALGALTGGIVGFLVPVIRDCGLDSGPGWLGFAVAAVGLLSLLLSLLGGRR